MSASRDFLLELGLEELPTRAVSDLSEALATALSEGLTEAHIAHGPVTVFGTPRRLAVLIEGVASEQPDRRIERRGPALSAAFDAEGKPSKAALGFARSCGVEISALGRLETEKGIWLQFEATQAGAPTITLLPDIIDKAARGLPVAKRMRWAAHRYAFVRPLKWLLSLFGEEVVEMSLFGQHAGRITYGHRFHAPAPITLTAPSEYAARLEKEGRVIASFADRRKRIEQAVMALTDAQATPIITPALLDEVTALVEWPVALQGRFDADFLTVPEEALIAVMQDHQKYFHMLDKDGKLAPAFVFISNLESAQPEAVVGGNERVIAPRLADARFFYERDREVPLASRADKLAGVTYQKRLGTLADKTHRVEALATRLAEVCGLDVASTRRAATLSRCDLTSLMVFEFPELQGIAGRYYALADGEPALVAEAIEGFYHPRYASDSLPGSGEARALALADRLDTLVGIFGIGQPPTGDRDPFALRRAALGIIRIAVEGRFDFDLDDAIAAAAAALQDRISEPDVVAQVRAFILERLRYWYLERGVDAGVFAAVAALPRSRLVDFDARVRAVAAFRDAPEAGALAAANKRSTNLLAKSAEAAEEGGATASDPSRMGAEEQALVLALEAARADTTPMLARAEYQAALTRMAQLRAPVDAFFDAVMVLDPDPVLRSNRIGILRELNALFAEVADLGALNS